MKSTSFGSRLVRIAARSPGRSSTGPEVERRLTPISRARMCARVVLPRPGGPNSSTWSSASPRPRAAWMKISNWPRILSWPTYSARVAGRKLRWICSSCTEEGLAEIRRSVSTATSGFCQSLERGPDAFGHREPGRQVLDRVQCLFFAIAQAYKGIEDIVRPCDGWFRFRLQDFPFQLEKQPFSRLLPYARNLGKPRRVLQRHRLREFCDRQPRKHGQRGARANARNADHLA